MMPKGRGENLRCSAAGIQCFSFSRTLHLGEFLPSWGSFEFRPSNWRTIAVLMLHYFHPNATLLLILLGKDHFFGYYTPVYIYRVFLLICWALTESDICRHFVRLKASAREKKIFELFSALCAFPLMPLAKGWYFLWSFSKSCLVSPLLKASKWWNLGQKR